MTITIHNCAQSKAQRMTITIHNCAQGSPEWFAVRAGIPTASNFAAIMASGRNGGDSRMRRTYMLKLAGEIITGELMENYTNVHMERGAAMEDEARDCYAFHQDAELQRVGFISRGRKGCSPDSLIGADGVLEIKTALPHLLIEHLLADNFPAEHKAQCQGALWVSERKWIDIAIYWPRLPLFIKQAQRDEEYIARLAAAVEAFNAELDDLVDQVRRYGEPAAAREDRLRAQLIASAHPLDIPGFLRRETIMDAG